MESQEVFTEMFLEEWKLHFKQMSNNLHVATEHEILFDNIDREMRERGWSIVKLAKEAGIKPNLIYNFRSGYPLSTESLYRIAKALGTTIDALKGIEAPATVVPVAVGEPLSLEEQDALMYLRRLTPDKRRAAVRILREVVDGMLHTP